MSIKIAFFAFIFMFISIYINCTEDYYKLIGVKRTATHQEIKKAFKKLSLKYEDDPKIAKEEFIGIRKAYEVLSNDEKRKIYDKYGEEGLKSNEQGGEEGDYFNLENKDFEDKFNSVFGSKNNFFTGICHFCGLNYKVPITKEQNYFKNTKVKLFKMKNLASFYSRKNIWFVYFFITEDYNFEKYVNSMIEFAEKTDGLFNAGAINCLTEEELCEKFGVFRTPSIIYFSENKKDYDEYKSSIDFNSLFNYAAERMSYYMNEITKENLNYFFAKKQDKYHIILFTNNESTPLFYKALSKLFINKLIFGEVQSTQTELVDLFKIKEFPTLMIMIDEEKNKYELYKKNQITFENLKYYLNIYTLKKKEYIDTKVREMNYNIYNILGTCSTSDIKSICLIYLTSLNKPNNKDMKILENIYDKYYKDNIKVFYINYKKNKNIFNSFEDVNELTTKAVIIKGRRKRYINLDKYEFENNIYNVIEKSIYGSGNFKKLKDELKLNNINVNPNIA